MSKIMLITGSSGCIGAAIALLAAKEGYSIIANYRQNEVAAYENKALIDISYGEV